MGGSKWSSICIFIQQYNTIQYNKHLEYLDWTFMPDQVNSGLFKAMRPMLEPWANETITPVL